MRAPENAHILLWDGECAFCRRCVMWVVRRDEKKRIWAVPYQEAPSPPMSAALRKRAHKAVQLIAPDGRTLEAGRACVEVLSLLGWERAVRVLGSPPLIWPVEWGYRLVARTRRFWGRLPRPPAKR